MYKKLFASIVAGTMALFLVNACAEDSNDAKVATQAETSVAEKANNDGAQSDSIMDQPVNFSTPENVEISLQNIREKEGESAYKRVQNAMKYISFYDLSVSNNKEKLYKKLDGMTPTAIIAKAKRR